MWFTNRGSPTLSIRYLFVSDFSLIQIKSAFCLKSAADDNCVARDDRAGLGSDAASRFVTRPSGNCIQRANRFGKGI